jgi:hypothetical protein
MRLMPVFPIIESWKILQLKQDFNDKNLEVSNMCSVRLTFSDNGYLLFIMNVVLAEKTSQNTNIVNNSDDIQ